MMPTATPVPTGCRDRIDPWPWSWAPDEWAIDSPLATALHADARALRHHVVGEFETAFHIVAVDRGALHEAAVVMGDAGRAVHHPPIVPQHHVVERPVMEIGEIGADAVLD